MTTAKFQRACAACGTKIEIGEEIANGPGGWMHTACRPAPAPALSPQWFTECGHSGHDADQQLFINERGKMKLRAALAGNMAELDRLAGLTPSCLQTPEEWLASTYEEALM